MFTVNTYKLQHYQNILVVDMVKVLWFIPSPRDFSLFKWWMEKVDFIDKLWIRFKPSHIAYKEGVKFFLDKDYDYMLISTDDILATPYHIQLLLEDIEKHNFDVVGGWINYDFNNPVSYRYASLTFKPPRGFNPKNPLSIHSARQYPFITIREIVAENWETPLIKVWFNGLALTMIKRWLVEKTKLQPFRIIKDMMFERGVMYDLKFSSDCEQLGVDYYVDLRCFCLHFGDTRKLLKVNKEKPYTLFIPAKGEPVRLN